MARHDLFYLRDPNSAAIGQRDCFIFVRGDDSVTSIQPENAELVSKILAALDRPIRLTELSKLSQAPREEVKKTLQVLLRHQVILSGSRENLVSRLPPPRQTESEKSCQHLVFGITGAVHALLIIPLMLRLRRTFAQHIDVVLTDAAQKFVKPEAFSYFGFDVWADPFSVRGEVNVPHIHLASRADLVAIIPASAHTIHRLATGECSDLLSLIVAATTAPVVVAPAMNSAMRRNPAVRRNIFQLRADGIFVVEPGWAFEVSKEQNEQLSPSGVGLHAQNIHSTLEAVMASHRANNAKGKRHAADRSVQSD